VSHDDAIALRDIADAAARKAGVLALDHYAQDVEAWQKGDKTPVTKTDLAVDKMLREDLTTARPDFGWLSEESHDDLTRLDKRDVWIVDPIDGTRAFVKGKPEWVIAIAAVRQGMPIAAVVFNPVKDELFDAAVGQGARLNGAPIQVSSRNELEGCHMLAYADLFARPEWPEPWPPMQVDQRNAIAYRMALVACGAFDAMLTLNLKSEWDIAAGALIAQEAGGQVTNHQGQPLTFNHPESGGHNLICAGPMVHKAILDRVSFIPVERIRGTSSN